MHPCQLEQGPHRQQTWRGKKKQDARYTLLRHWSVVALVGPGSWHVAISFLTFRRATADRHEARMPPTSLTR